MEQFIAMKYNICWELVPKQERNLTSRQCKKEYLEKDSSNFRHTLHRLEARSRCQKPLKDNATGSSADIVLAQTSWLKDKWSPHYIYQICITYYIQLTWTENLREIHQLLAMIVMTLKTTLSPVMSHSYICEFLGKPKIWYEVASISPHRHNLSRCP